MPPPWNTIPHQNLRVGGAVVKWERVYHPVNTIPSPVNPARLYYEFNILYANSIEFGMEVADKSMIGMRTVHAIRSIQFMLLLNRKELDIQFPLNIDGEMCKFRFRLPIARLSKIYKVFDGKTDQINLVIPFGASPQFFQQMKEGEELSNGRKHTSFSSDRVWSAWNTWYRETDVVEEVSKKRLRHLPLMNHKDTAIIDIGRWTMYRLAFDSSTIASTQFEEFSDILTDHGIAIETLDQYDVKDRITPPPWKILQEEVSGTHPHFDPRMNNTVFDTLFAEQIHLSFPVRYQLEACVSNGYLKEHNITKSFLERLASLDPLYVTCVLEKVVDKQNVYHDPMDIFNIRINSGSKVQIPHYCVLQRSVVITPTMMHVGSPVMETSNRIIRKYAADGDRFIRVKFSDEKDEGPLRNMPNDRAEPVFERVRRAMKNGIVVAGRFYEFLAFGNSQFREHGAFFYAPTASKSADDIRLSLGRFDHIKSVAKFGARLGQCFSTTRAMRISVKIVKIPDIQRNNCIFTDGVGKLSLFLAQMAAEELGLSNAFSNPPSLFQFRLGGCKGVLALDPTLPGKEVHIRPSQQKFDAEYTGLEIIRSSALATSFFNRQIIVVLSTLGVPDYVFIKKQQKMVDDYEQAMSNEKIALQKLRKHIDMNQTTLTIAGMVHDGFMATQDPFVMSLLQLWRAFTIKNLKEKARIAVDEGAFVLGCVDETATLRGHFDNPQSRSDATRDQRIQTLPEIFLQIDDTSRIGHYRIIEGVCLLARNPSLHPGDIRVVRAVNVPRLNHLKNVVVLPQTGDRDLASMCSGGDLDGDDYMILWDLELLPETINVPPMDFTPERPLDAAKPITVSDITEFFVTYMKNDSLGQIAHAHLAQADFHAEGVGHDTCLELAKLHSQAVDYPKSGIPAVMESSLRPQKWPHFMEKKNMPKGKIYKSNKILGTLYDQVQLVNFVPQWENAFDKRILEAFELDAELLIQAALIKASYDESLKRLMAKHGVSTEFEAWSIFVLAHNHESRDYKFAEEFGRTVSVLKVQFRERCRAAAQAASMADWTHLGPFVTAMYVVTAREMEAAIKECHTMKIVGGQPVPKRVMRPEHMPFISFPWLFPSELGKIATTSSPMKAQHNFIFRQKKNNTGRGLDPDVGAATFESEEGIISYGQLLNLDFIPLQSSHASPERQGMTQRDESYRLVECPRSASGAASMPNLPHHESLMRNSDMSQGQQRKVGDNQKEEMSLLSVSSKSEQDHSGPIEHEIEQKVTKGASAIDGCLD